MAGVLALLAWASSNAARAIPSGAAPRAEALRLGPFGVLPGLQLAVPHAWSVAENTVAELKLAAPSHSGDLAVWLDVRAVKSSGRGHGTTVLRHIGKSPRSLVAWLTRNHDFHIVSRPASATLGNRVKATTLALGVSRAANYGDPGCPANPRCADLFRNPATWLHGDFFGIGGKEQVRLYFAGIKRSSSNHTLEVVLDAASHAQLLRLKQDAKGLLRSIRLPHGVSSG